MDVFTRLAQRSLAATTPSDSVQPRLPARFEVDPAASAAGALAIGEALTLESAPPPAPPRASGSVTGGRVAVKGYPLVPSPTPVVPAPLAAWPTDADATPTRRDAEDAALPQSPALPPTVQPAGDAEREPVGLVETPRLGEPAKATSRPTPREVEGRPRLMVRPTVVVVEAPATRAEARQDQAGERLARGDAAPTIRVTIGRVEVRAMLPAAPTRPQPAPAPRPSEPTLEDYLAGRKGPHRR